MPKQTVRNRQSINTKRRIGVAGIIVAFIVFSAAMFAYSISFSNNGDLAGNVLIWHTYVEDDEEAFNLMLDDYETFNPNINVHQQSFDTPEELLAQYELTAKSGLGPDLFIGNAEWVTPLIQESILDAYPRNVVEEIGGQYLPAAIEAFTYDGDLYGLPISLDTPALFYNKKLVDEPPETLDALLTQAADGHTVLLSTNFKDAFWGVQAFGGKFMDAEGRVILDQGGYANWLDWLMTARNAPGMILDSNRSSLLQRFQQGDASYYVGYPSEVDALIESLGQENVGVAPLPSGPTGSAGPLLDVNGVLLSPSSSGNQRSISIDLASYLTNAEQSALLMNMAMEIPANASVRINSRLHPIAAGFLAQARSAVRLPNTDVMSEAWSIADRAYRQVLSGLLSPVEAATTTTTSINELTGMTVANRTDPVCTDLGTIRLVHNWDDGDADVLDEMIASYRKTCPLVIIEVDREDLSTTLSNWQRFPWAATNPDVILAPQSWLAQAVNAGIPLKDITPAVGNDTLQRYLPPAIEGVRVDNRLMGLPLSARVGVLYYNESMIVDPAHALESLRLQADDGIPITLSAEFVPAYWGIGAFGGRMMDDEDLPVLHNGPFADWMEWLQESSEDHSIVVTTTPGQAKIDFIEGRSAYYVGEPSELGDLALGIGINNLGLALLPSGPEGPATPLFETTGFFFNDQLDESDLATALGFALNMTNADNQNYLVQHTLRMPTNATVDLADRPQMAIYLEQAKTAYPVPNCVGLGEVAAVGDQAYIDVLEDGVDPDLAARDVSISMYEVCGLDYTQDPVLGNTPTAKPTETANPTTSPVPDPNVTTGPTSTSPTTTPPIEETESPEATSSSSGGTSTDPGGDATASPSPTTRP